MWRPVQCTESLTPSLSSGRLDAASTPFAPVRFSWCFKEQVLGHTTTLSFPSSLHHRPAHHIHCNTQTPPHSTPTHVHSLIQQKYSHCLRRDRGMLRFEGAKGASRPFSLTRSSRMRWQPSSWRQNRKQLPQRVQNLRKRLSQKKPKTLKKRKRAPNKKLIYSSDEDDDVLCLLCMGPYSCSRPGENWLQCVGCRNWSHEDCAAVSGGRNYLRHNCNSDDEYA